MNDDLPDPPESLPVLTTRPGLRTTTQRPSRRRRLEATPPRPQGPPRQRRSSSPCGPALVWVERSFRSVAPGEAGLVVGKFTGSDADRVAGQPLPPAAPCTSSRASGYQTSSSRAPAASFTVPTRDGFAVGLVIQARWALDRRQLLARWAGLPADPGRRSRRPGSRVLLPRHRSRVRRPVASREQAGGARGTRREAGRRAPRRGRDRPQGRARRATSNCRSSSSAAASRSSSSRSSSSAPRRTSASRSRRSSSSGSRPRRARPAPTRRPRRPRIAASSRRRPSPTRWRSSCR